MNTFLNMFSSDYWWITIVFFVLFTFFSFLIGFILGTKATFWFLFWNVIGYIIFLLMTEKIINVIIKEKDSDRQNIFNESMSFIVPAILFLVMLAWNFLVFLFYFFFRKRLKKRMKENVKNGSTNILTRIFGGMFGIITFAPLIFLSCNIGVVFSSNNKLQNINNQVIKYLTFNKYEGLGGKGNEFKEIVKKIIKKDSQTKQKNNSNFSIDILYS